MTPSKGVPPNPPRRYVEPTTPKQPAGFTAVLTLVLLAAILLTGPLVLGAARLWIELPILLGVSVLMLIQGVRLMGPPADKTSRHMDVIDITVVLFVLYTIIRWLGSPTEYFSRLEMVNVVAYATVFFTCRYGISRRKYGLTLLFLLVALGVGEMIFGYCLSHHSDPRNPQTFWLPFGPTEQLHVHYSPRWVGTYGCPNHYVSLLIMAAAAALSIGSFSRLSWPLRIVLFYLAGMIMIGVVYTGSRGGAFAFLAMVLALAIFAIRYGMLRWWIPVATSVVLLAFFVSLYGTSAAVVSRFVNMADTTMGSMGGVGEYVRIQLDMDALRIARDYPALGTGPGTFVFIHPRYQQSNFAFKAVLTHDDYLNCLDDYGAVGFALAMFFVAAVTLKFFGRMRADNRWPDRAMLATGFGIWCAYLIHSTVDFNLHIPANALLFFSLTGLALGRIAMTESIYRHWSTIPLTPVSRGLGAVVVFLSLIYGAQVTRTMLSDLPYEKVVDNVRRVPADQSTRELIAALRYDPGNAQALVLLGDLYRYQASRQQDLEGRTKGGLLALDAYQRGLKANTLDDTIRARMGMTFDVMRRYTEAYFCYVEAVHAQPYNGQFWNALGNHFWQRGLLEKAEQAYLLAAKCPHGSEGSRQAADELRALLILHGIPPPAPGTNPVETQSAEEEPVTTP